MGKIHCGDNLKILADMDANSIDLIYLDPPFNTKKTWTGKEGSKAEGSEFSDVFKEDSIQTSWLVITNKNKNLRLYLEAIKQINITNYYYLLYMAIRLIEMKRVLKNTGSIYLHCDPTMSHYLKIVLDCIFGEDNFRNEIVWHYGGLAAYGSNFQKMHDLIFIYAKTNKYVHNRQYQQFSNKSSGPKLNKKKNSFGKWVTDKSTILNMYEKRKKGVLMHDVWELPYINSMAKERVGYPTQKPIKLLERIIKASSNEGDIVLDPFCGSGTTLIAAERLHRKWIGIDKSEQAYKVFKDRMDKEAKYYERIH